MFGHVPHNSSSNREEEEWTVTPIFTMGAGELTRRTAKKDLDQRKERITSILQLPPQPEGVGLCQCMYVGESTDSS